MPALIANTVALEEVLEVRAGPLNEEELWSLLSQSCEALQDVFIRDSPNDRSYTAPETYARRAFPSEAALEKICVYSLGMSLYHAAEFEVAIGKPISLNEPLENVLLSMCEDSAQLRSTLAEVLEECHIRYKSRNYRDVVASLVESLLGDEIPNIELEDTEFDSEPFQNTSDYHGMNGEVYPSRISPVLASPRHLPTPPPPPPHISTRGQPTSAQLVGSNHRRVSTPPLTQRSTSPRLNGSRNLPPSLEKYKSFLEDSRSKRSMAASLNGLDQLDSREPGSSYLQPPSKQQRMTENESRRSASPHYHGNYELPPPKVPPDLEPRVKLSGNSSGGEGLRRFSSVNSVTSISSSSASGPRSSMFSDGRSSSAISLTQGSYAPESYLTDGYDSEFYLNSLESSVFRDHIRDGRDAPSMSDEKYLSINDLHQPPGLGSMPRVQMSSGKQFTSVPDINKEALLSQSRKKGALPNDPVKTFFGPEFVMITEDPEKSTVNLTPNTYLKKDAQKKGGSQSRKMVTVIALNGQKLQLMAEVSMTTKDLYGHVIKFLGITEKSFFGLAKLEDDEVIFLELDVKLSKYAPPKWKESKGEMVEFILYFRVKFYVEHVSLLSHLSTRHQFYLQLRKDVLEGRLYCHEEAAFILAGLALQAETGDMDESLDQEYFLVEHYLHPRIINKVSAEYTASQLPEYHHKFAGLSEDQAEQDFLEEAQKLPEYGIHFYKVQANKKSDAEKLYLGICVRGITVYEAMGHIKSPIHKHSWPLTKKISFKKKKFFIEPRGNPDGAKLTFYTSHYKKAKYLLSMCTAFHRFQMKMRTRLASIEHEVALDFATEKQQQRQLSVDCPPKPSPYERSPPSYKQSAVSTQKDSLPRSVSQEYNKSTEDLRHYREMSVDVNHNTDFHGDGIRDRNKLGKRMLSTPSIRDDLDKEKHDDIPYVIDSTLNDPHKQDSLQDAVKDNLHQNTDIETVPRTKDIFKSPDREIKVIKLRKEPLKGLGITVLGGENSKRLDLGIYVKSVTEGGAAAKDGRLKAGDRILAVNGNSVENVTHEQAVSLLKTTSSTVELVVSQSPHNVSALDLSSIPSAASTNEEPQTLEIKPLITPPQHNTQLKQQQRVESPWSSETLSPTESPASTFNFPSEDEPVTLISKSISSLAANPPASKRTFDRPASKQETYREVARTVEKVPEPVTVATVESLNSQPMEMFHKEPALPLVDSRISSMDSHQSELSSESYTAGSERSTDYENTDKSSTVELEKVNGSLGLSVTGGINTTVKHGAIFVKSLILNGPADMNGHIRVGDRILEVNGISLKSVTHKQAVEIIKRAPQHCNLLIDRSIHVNVPTSIKKTRSKTLDKPFLVELMKGIGGLGLSLVGGRDADPEHGGLLRIKKMFPGQPAALSNKLQVGDIVLEVNSMTLENATHQDAINMIRHENSIVRLLVKREPSSMPAVLLNRAASDASDIDPVQLLTDIQTKLRSDVANSPSLETHKRHTTLKPEPHLDVELSNQSYLPDRTEVWVKQESPKPHGYGFENERSLTHQLSDPSAIITRNIEHEPVTTSFSLPGKFAVKPRYFEKVPEESRVEEEKTPIDSIDVDIAENLARKDSDKIVSEPDLHSLLNKHVKSQDSLYRTMSPQAPLAEYEESDIDEGIMISVDDGTIVHIDNSDDNSDEEDYDIDTTLTNTLPPISDDDDDDDIHTPKDFNSFSKNNRTLDDDDEDDKSNAPNAIPTLTRLSHVSDDDDTNDVDSIVDSQDSEEDINEVLKLLEAVQRDTAEETTYTFSSGKTVEPEQTQKDTAITVDIQASLPEQSPQSLHFPSSPLNRTNIYEIENEPNRISLEDDEVNNSPYILEDQPQQTSFSAINVAPGNHGDDDDESDSDVSLDGSPREVHDGGEEETHADSTLTVEDNDESSRLTPKEELLTVELEKRDSGGLGFTLAGGADTMGGCFVRDIIGDPAKSDGRLKKGDQILQVDGIDIRDMKHMQAVNVLRSTKKNVKLIVLRRPVLVVSDGDSGQLETVNLTRTSRGRIGLLLTEGDEGVILVDDVVPGEPAAVEGNLKHGDRIIEIAGRKVDGIGFLAARQYLDAARPVVQLLVEKKNRAALSKYSMSGTSLEQSFSLSEDLPVTENIQSDENNTDDNQESDIDEQKDEVITIELDKGPRGFGFSLVAAPSPEPNVQAIFIKTISPGTVAENDGRLRVGDQILKVNEEDVRGLSHARVIGMLRKVTTTVTMEIRRPGNTVSSREVKTSTSSPSKTTRSPPSKSLDLDITLEDKETLTGSSEVKDEDDILDLLTTISSANSQTTPTNTLVKPKLRKRDTDSVLSSLLSSIGSPSPSSNTNHLYEVDSNHSTSDDDTSSPPNSLGSPPLGTESPPLHSGSPQLRAGSPPLRTRSPPLGARSPPYSRGSSPVSVDFPPLNLDSTFDKDIPGDLLQRFSSGSFEEKKRSISSNERQRSESEETSSDSDYDDVDVFDMLHDNSETNTQKDSIDIGKKTQQDLAKIIDSYADMPPPLPTTPIPSDDEEDRPPLPPRKESLLKSSDDNWSSGDSDFSSQPKVNGFVGLHSSSSEGDMMSRPDRPLVDVISGGRYTGHKLKMLIGALQSKLDSNAPSDEFKALRGIKPTDGCEAAKHPDNREKNRYRNVLPFDTTRVRLSGEGIEDYINASHIRVPVGQDTYHYIATQGPLPNTITDFWQMVWEQGVEVIAMVTLEQETGKAKCSRYWPDSPDKPFVMPRFEVSLQEKKTSESFVERKISLKHLESGDSIEVTHLNFTTWPDHGVPKCSVEIVEFVKYMRYLTSTQAPILVHCSAGIGRTGALITVDVALGLIQRDLLFDVDKIIRILRGQRQGMIQTKDQYIFCYKACLEVLRSLTV